jgi:hypothetical protein
MFFAVLFAIALGLIPFAVYRYGSRGPLNNPKYPQP